MHSMSLLLNHYPYCLPSLKYSKFTPKSFKPHSISLTSKPRFLFSIRSSYSSYSFNDATDPPSRLTPEVGSGNINESSEKPTFVDEWGEKSELEPEPVSKFSGPDPPRDEDEWVGKSVDMGNGSPGVEVGGGVSLKKDGDEKLYGLKRALLDTVYGSEFGFRASSEVRAEALELVLQLEGSNPTPAPTERPELLDGSWVLVYTAFSELLPLLAVGSIPLLKVDKIGQEIDTSSLTIENSTTLSSPVANVSFSASAAFEVRSPSRIQVEFKEGKFNPPEFKSSINLPENLDVFGQKINLSPVQQSLNPFQNAVASIGRSISGQPPLRASIPGERAKSFLVITYLDEDFRISRGDGGLFVLVKEGSPLVDQ